MITKLPPEKLLDLGIRYRADYLCEQAGYTLGLAAGDGAALAEMLPAGYLEEASEVLAELNAARQDRTLMAEDSRGATRGQNKALRQAKLWRRRVVKRAGRAHNMGEEVPAALLHATKASTVPEVAAQAPLEAAQSLRQPVQGVIEGITRAKKTVSSMKKLLQDVRRIIKCAIWGIPGAKRPAQPMRMLVQGARKPFQCIKTLIHCVQMLVKGHQEPSKEPQKEPRHPWTDSIRFLERSLLS